MSAILYAGTIILAVILLIGREIVIRHRTVTGTVELLAKKLEREDDRVIKPDERKYLIMHMKKVYDRDPKKARKKLAYLRKHPEFLEDA